MRVNRAQNNTSTTFSSQLTPTRSLRLAFNHAIDTKDSKFLKSVKLILNDGKKREITAQGYRSTIVWNPDCEYQGSNLFVNGQSFVRQKNLVNTSMGLYSNDRFTEFSLEGNIARDVKYLINKFASQEYPRAFKKEYHSQDVKKELEQIKSTIFE